ncbi:MAG TPA: hypothetical protein VLV15_12225, partial [Dongiaceae bacterium]|nr:hypothetical protein [Dongiaceae bacterium]
HRAERRHGSDERWHRFELVVEPRVLRRRIETRAAWMFAHGLVEETRALLAAGYTDALRALHAIGYDEAIAHLEGGWTLAAAIERTALRTTQLAKRQRTWFRHQTEAHRLTAEPFDAAILATEVRARLPDDFGRGSRGRAD